MPKTFNIYEDKENFEYNYGSMNTFVAPFRKSKHSRAILADVCNIAWCTTKEPSLKEWKSKNVCAVSAVPRNGTENRQIKNIVSRKYPISKTLSLKDPLEGFDVYRAEVYSYLKSCESRRAPKPCFMNKQHYATTEMRTILVDWMIDIAVEFSVENESLYIAVGLVDRFLTRYSVKKANFQLLGISAMFLAAKYEAVYPLRCLNYSYMTAEAYSVDQILIMESYILKGLSFNLLFPTIFTFLNQVSWDVHLVEKIKNLSMFLCELILVQGDPYFEFPSSLIAASAIAYSRSCIGYCDPWPSCLVDSTGYCIEDIRPVAFCIFKTHSNAPTSKQRAVINKYATDDLDNVSFTPCKPFPVA